MAKAKRNTGKAKPQPKKKSKQMRPQIGGAMRAAMAWKHLLTDPCTADLAYPCYSGTDAGYLIRTVDQIQPALSGTYTVGQAMFADVCVSYTPSNVSATTGTQIAINNVGSPLAFSSTGSTNFITASGCVKGYRPVAACLKFIPIGPISGRSGEVGMGYINDTFPATASGAAAFMAMAQLKASTGGINHEVNWLPCAQDETFTTLTTTIDAGAGTVFTVLRGVDATAVSTAYANVNGYIEATTIWEWTPTPINAVAVDPRTPVGITSQSVLASFGDIKNALFAQAHGAATRIGGMMARGAAGAAIDYASRSFMGISNPRARMPGNSMPLLTY
nr:MAG: hypothetical protein [Chemarfal virus 123]